MPLLVHLRGAPLEGAGARGQRALHGGPAARALHRHRGGRDAVPRGDAGPERRRAARPLQHGGHRRPLPLRGGGLTINQIYDVYIYIYTYVCITI